MNKKESLNTLFNNLLFNTLELINSKQKITKELNAIICSNVKTLIELYKVLNDDKNSKKPNINFYEDMIKNLDKD